MVQALPLHIALRGSSALPSLLAVATCVGTASAIANNLTVSASAPALLAAGPAAYAATIGLAVGALATPHGSVATLLASDLAGARAPVLPVRRFVPSRPVRSRSVRSCFG